MKNFRRVTALLLVLCMCLSFASATEITEEHSHGIVSEEEITSSGIQELTVSGTTKAEPPVENETTTPPEDTAEIGTTEDGILHANLIEDPSGGRMTWELDNGTLWIGGYGLVKPISSADEQPWAEVRTEITDVRFHSDAQLIIESIAYWFAGCTNLVYAEIPAYAFSFGDYAFQNCVSLEELGLYHAQDPAFTATTFEGIGSGDIFVYVSGPEALQAVQQANWHGRSMDAMDLSEYPIALYDGPCGINGCNCTSCTYYYEYDQYDEYYHWKYAVCTNCSANEYPYGGRWEHTFNSNGICTICGYEESYAGCDHSRSYYEWEGCTYYEYCYYCDEYLGYGIEHGSYYYGDWVYYSTSQHRRTKTCSDCGESSYTYGYHSTTTKYTYVSTTQHSVSSYCATCDSTVGSSSNASHTFTYGTWEQYNAYQHRRSINCAPCNYGSYEYYAHSDNNGDGKCDTCSYGMSVSVTWNAGTNGGTVNGAASVTTSVATGATATAPNYTPLKTGHTFKGWYTASTGGSLYNTVTVSAARTFYAQFTPASYTITFDPGDGELETTTKSVTYGDTYGELPEPTRAGYSFFAWFTEEDGGTQITPETKVDITADQTLYASWIKSTVFSVTVPATLPIIVDQYGQVHTVHASIVNNSSEDVKVSSVSLSAMNGWTIVPYDTDIAREKVDADLIGFSIQDAQTLTTGETEKLSLPHTWEIAESSSLDLTYDAVVSALSQPVSDLDVLSVIFILEWAGEPK